MSTGEAGSATGDDEASGVAGGVAIDGVALAITACGGVKFEELDLRTYNQCQFYN